MTNYSKCSRVANMALGRQTQVVDGGESTWNGVVGEGEISGMTRYQPSENGQSEFSGSWVWKEYLSCSRNRQKVSVPAALWAQLRGTRDEVGETDHADTWTFYFSA